MKQKLKIGKQGITLIALIITIIVLLILAGVSIAMLTGENGILTQAQKAKEKTEEAEKDEMKDIAILEEKIDGKGTDIEEVTDKNPGVLELEDSTYVINSIEDLVFFAYSVTNENNYEGQTVKLGLSLDFNSSKSYVNPFRTDYAKYGYEGNLKTLLTSGEGFKPIGTTNYNYSNTYTNNIFKGIFDGNGFKIYNLKINKITKKLNSAINEQEQIYVALFSGNEGIIQNLGVCNAKIDVSMLEGRWNAVGIIAGTNFENSKIENCYATGQINVSIGTDANIGGLVGSNFGNVFNCYNSADLYCENSNLIDKSVRISSLVGTSEETGIISNVYNTGDINLKCIEEIPENHGTTQFQIGTVARYTNNNTPMKNGYNIGNLFLELINDEAYKYNISPIVSGGHEAENFYNLEELKYDLNGFSNLNWIYRETKKSSNEMKTDEFVDLLNQDQEDVWTRDENINEGYPIFIWQK